MKVILDTETGEIIDEIKEGDRIRRKEQDQYYKDKVELINMDSNGEFVKLFNKTMAELGREELTANEYNICLQLLNYIEYESGILTPSDERIEQFASIFNISPDELRHMYQSTAIVIPDTSALLNNSMLLEMLMEEAESGKQYSSLAECEHDILAMIDNNECSMLIKQVKNIIESEVFNL